MLYYSFLTRDIKRLCSRRSCPKCAGWNGVGVATQRQPSLSEVLHGWD